MISNRVKEISASQTMMFAAEAKKLKAEGIDIIDLSVGEPDFYTPSSIKDAGKMAIDQNETRYTINQGTIELRNAICKKLKRENNLNYKVNEIIASSGAKQSVFNGILSLINPGDEVIIPNPYWVSYPSMVNLAQGKSVILDTDESNGFKITVDQLKSNITDKTKMLILCNPSNPTGSVYNKKELEAIAQVVLENNIYVLSDEIYEKIVYDDFEFISFPSIDDCLKDKTILVNGFSKGYAMTGWRIGYAAANERIISAMNTIQSHSTSHPSSISQIAAIEAINGSQEFITEMVQNLNKRRNFFYDALLSVKGINCCKPKGAFYLFPNVSQYFNTKTSLFKINNSLDLVIFLLYEAHVAVVPGSAFGKEGYIRLAYAAPMENLEAAGERIKKALSQLL